MLGCRVVGASLKLMQVKSAVGSPLVPRRGVWSQVKSLCCSLNLSSSYLVHLVSSRRDCCSSSLSVFISPLVAYTVALSLCHNVSRRLSLDRSRRLLLELTVLLSRSMQGILTVKSAR